MVKRYYLVFKLVAVTFWLAGSFVSNCVVAQAEPFKVEISLPKTQFVVSEPIPATATVTNISEQAVQVEEIIDSGYIEWLWYELEKLDGPWADDDVLVRFSTQLWLVGAREPNEDEIQGWRDTGTIPPTDLNPGASLTWTWSNILEDVKNQRISTGSYRIKACYGYTATGEEIYSNTIEFTVSYSSLELDLQLTLDKPKYTPGEPIIATATLTNKGTEAVKVFPVEILNNYDSLSYEITNPSGQVCEYIGDMAEIAYYPGLLINLSPNQSTEATDDITQYYSITQLGTYTAKAIYRWELSDYGEWSGTLESNTVTFEVVQSGASLPAIKVAVDGKTLATTGIIAKQICLVSAELFRRIGAQVDLGDKIVIRRNNNAITVFQHVHLAEVNGKTIKVDMPAIKVKDGKIMVPLRLVAEALGAKVRWESKTKTVYITI